MQVVQKQFGDSIGQRLRAVQEAHPLSTYTDPTPRKTAAHPTLTAPNQAHVVRTARQASAIQLSGEVGMGARHL